MPKIDTGLKDAQIRRILDDLMLPYKIDLVVYEDIRNRNLREHIDRMGLPLERLG